MTFPSWLQIEPSEVMTRQEMEALKPHPGWNDGRHNYPDRFPSVWCHFTATLDVNRRLRAEISWKDDSLFNDSGDPTVYFNAGLWLPAPQEDMGKLSFDGIPVDLTKDDSITLVTSDPSQILEKYTSQISQLKVWQGKE